MAMSLSYPHPGEPYRQTGVRLGDKQFAMAADWERSGPPGPPCPPADTTWLPRSRRKNNMMVASTP
jgi:hypothetical protein